MSIYKGLYTAVSWYGPLVGFARAKLRTLDVLCPDLQELVLQTFS